MRLALLTLLVAAACGPAATGGATTPATHAATPHATASPTPVPVDMNDMMGGAAPDATVFTFSEGQIHAVTLLNHFVRYRIPVSGRPHVAVNPSGVLMFVADELDGGTRLRSFDVMTGVEFGSLRVPEPPAGEAALALTQSGEMYLLTSAGGGVVLGRIQTSPLAAVVDVAKSECGDRLLASAMRIAIVCEATGTVELLGLGGGQVASRDAVTVPGAPIVASAMLADGTIVIGNVERDVFRINADGMTPEHLSRRGGAIIADGIAAAGPSTFVVFSEMRDGAVASVFDRAGIPTSSAHMVSVRLPGSVALWPFAYFSGDRGVWHVDLRTGLLERMLTLVDPVPLAVSQR